MKLFDIIKGPVSDKESLKKIIERYSKSNSGLYYAVVLDEQYDKSKRNKYLDEFADNIIVPCIEDYINESKKYSKDLPDFARLHDAKTIYEAYLKIQIRLNKLDKEKDEYRVDLSPKTIPLGYNKEETKKYEDQLKLIEKKVEEKSKELMKKYNITDEELKISNFVAGILSRYVPGDNIMGFHINNKNLRGENVSYRESGPKLYVNANEDTYKFAREFWKKCDERGIKNFYFKVAYPRAGEEDRLDKMCIYMENNEIPMYIDILKEIREENPNFDYQEPQLFAGNINGWIGIGHDGSGPHTSHSSTLSSIIKGSIEEVTGGKIERKDLYKFFSKNDDKLSQLQAVIKEKAKEKGLCESNLAICKDDVDKFKDMELIERKKSPKARKNPSKNEEKNQIVHIPTEQKESKEQQVEQDKKDTTASNGSKKEKPDDNKKTTKAASVKENLDELKATMKQMAIDYTVNYEEYNKKDARLKELTRALYEQRAEKLNIKESKMEKAMNIRRLDAIVSNIVVFSRKINSEAHTGEVSKLSMEELNFSMKELDDYMAVLTKLNQKDKTKSTTQKDTPKKQNKSVTKRTEKTVSAKRADGKFKNEKKKTVHTSKTTKTKEDRASR